MACKGMKRVVVGGEIDILPPYVRGILILILMFLVSRFLLFWVGFLTGDGREKK